MRNEIKTKEKVQSILTSQDNIKQKIDRIVTLIKMETYRLNSETAEDDLRELIFAYDKLWELVKEKAQSK